MQKYLHAILVFDVLVPALLLGLPGCFLLWAIASFQNYAEVKIADFSAHEARVRMIESLTRELKTVQTKVPLLKKLLAETDIESRVDRSIVAAVGKLSPDEIERTLADFQFGPSLTGQALGDGHRLSLKFASRWEELATAAFDWENSCPNLVLENLSIGRAASSPGSAPYLESSLSYFIITEN